MSSPWSCALVLAMVLAAVPAQDQGQKKQETQKEEPALPEDSLYRLKVKSLEGKESELKAYAGKVTLVVNVASKCGYTPQYEGLEKLQTELKAKGFSVLGFPSNDFGGQEPGTPAEIREFCSSRYKVTFPLFEKVVTKQGEGQSPVYANLAKQTKSLPAWNFCKYLVGKDGKVIKFYGSKVPPSDAVLRQDIEAALKK